MTDPWQQQQQQAQQIAALQRELAARDESVFDLQATLVTVEAERQSQAQQAQTQIQLLQEQLRRTQHEANITAAATTTALRRGGVVQTTTATTTSTSSHKNNPPPPPALPSHNHRTTTTSASVNVRMDTSTKQQHQPSRTAAANNPWWESGPARVPLRAGAARAEPPPSSIIGEIRPAALLDSFSSFPEPRTRQRLAQQLLLLATTNNHTTVSTPQYHSELQRHLTRIMTLPSAAGTLTEWHVIIWLVQELLDAVVVVTILGTDTTTTTTMSGSDDHHHKTAVLLGVLHDALNLSPSSCHILRRLLASTHTSVVHPPPTILEPPPLRRIQQRSSCLRMVVVSNTNSNSSNNNDTRNLYQQRLQQVEQDLSSPLWKNHPWNPSRTTIRSSTNKNPVVDDDDDEDHLYHGPEHDSHRRRVQRLVQVLADCACGRGGGISQPQQPQPQDDEKKVHLSLDTAIAALQVLQTIGFDYDGEDGHLVEQEGENHDTPNCFPSRLLTLWTTVVSELWLTARFSSSNNNNNNNKSTRRGARSFDHHPTTIPLRLVSTTNTKSTTTRYSPSHDMKTQWRAIVTAAVTSSTTNNWLLRWLAESLLFLRSVWLSSSSSVVRPEWLSQGLVANLLASAVDVLQHVILPDSTLYSHSLALAIVAWFQTLATTTTTTMMTGANSPRGRSTTTSTTTIMNDRQCMVHSPTLRLLRTQQPTTRTTTEQWHLAPTAVAVAVQLLYRVVVVEQNQHMPIPKARAAALGNVLRDHLIRFLHALLQAVQDDRRQWERESSFSSDHNNNPPPRRAPPLSFLTLLSECTEWYASAASLLLTMAAPPPESANRKSELYYNPCAPHPDIVAMVQMQLDELADDQMEQLAMDE